VVCTSVGVRVREVGEEVLERWFDGVFLRAVDADGDDVFEHVVIRSGMYRLTVNVVRWFAGSSLDVVVEEELRPGYEIPKLFFKLEYPDLELFTRERLNNIKTLEDLKEYLNELNKLITEPLNILEETL
jgi:hypothetical protein